MSAARPRGRPRRREFTSYAEIVSRTLSPTGRRGKAGGGVGEEEEAGGGAGADEEEEDEEEEAGAGGGEGKAGRFARGGCRSWRAFISGSLMSTRSASLAASLRAERMSPAAAALRARSMRLAGLLELRSRREVSNLAASANNSENLPSENMWKCLLRVPNTLALLRECAWRQRKGNKAQAFQAWWSLGSSHMRVRIGLIACE
jgi:hypothetical protein